ncbi:MAG: NAD(P)H-hydrate dehydratase [Rhodocyclaceae bacterium]|jgi:hydroxyethylthiazole kinase-like uncharacterized protein yjeF|nr:NAD(P)H-hydrate dehydratase [Rhodocyclaceae bacterium]
MTIQELIPRRLTPLLLSPQMRDVERRHAELPLMERAGTAAAQLAGTLAAGPAPILVLAGPGNNGGDAFVLARRLHEAGRAVTTVFHGEPSRLPADALIAYQRWQATGKPTHPAVPSDDYSLVVDGLFGIGLSRPVSGTCAQLITQINAYRDTGGPVLALDVPSGLNADTGAVHGIAVRASHTATFIADKPGLYTLAGPDHAGCISVHELGVGDPAFDGALLSLTDFASALQPRQRDTHKGSHGSLAVIGGAPGMCGAALLAARASLHLGAGRVFVGLLDQNHPAVDSGQPELMLRTPVDAIDHATAVVAGPGMGLNDEALTLMRRLTSADLPLLLDADALTLLGAHPVLSAHVRRRTTPTLLTPHPGEAARLLGISTTEVQSDRISTAIRLATHFNACVALKGAGTVLARPDGTWRINTTGNPGLATGGTGDVLSGMAGALLAQGWEAWSALCAAVSLHGAAADVLVCEGVGPVGLTASELLVPARRLLNNLIAESAERRQGH